MDISSATTVLAASTFRRNAAKSGGAVSSSDCRNLTVFGCTFEGGYAKNYGGAIYSSAALSVIISQPVVPREI